MAGRVFSFDPAVRQLAADALSDLHDALAKTCRLFYPAPGDPAANGWATGGRPPPAADPPHEDVVMQVAMEAKHFFVKPSPGVAVPAGTCQTKCYYALGEKLVRAAKMVVDPDNAAGLYAEFTRASDPVDPSNIARGVFLVTEWRRPG